MLRIVSTTDDATHTLIPGKTYKVGRKQGDILFPGDSSISRLHAELLVEHPPGNINEPLLTPTLTVTDLGSKFGTYATENGIRDRSPINPRTQTTLAIGDKFRFGLQNNVFRIEYTPLVVITSSVKATPEFKETVVKLGGHFIGEWDDHVTHVVMESITLTIKAVCALLKAKPIVTMAYLKELLYAYEFSQPLPDPADYVPPVTEKGIMDVERQNFAANPARTTLFAGKTFLFCHSKHLKKMKAAVNAGGGIAMLITDAKMKNVIEDDCIIMGQQSDISVGERDPEIKNIIRSYKTSGKRIVQDSEIGLAAVHNSIVKHCNPRCKVTDAVLPHLVTQSQNGSSAPVIVPETQNLESQPSSSANTSRRIVNETVVTPDSVSMSESGGSQSTSGRLDKRPHPSSSDEGSDSSSAKKRSATESLPRRTSKRLREAPPPPIISSKSNKTLHSLFNLDDSDDEEKPETIVPETQLHADSDDGGPGIVAESQPQSQIVNIVNVRNLQSITETQESNVSMQHDDDVFVVPASPPESTQTPTLPRNLGTDNISTITESIMNAATIPVILEPLDSLVNSPRTRVNTSKNKNMTPATIEALNSNGESSKKRRREEEESGSPINVKKINLTDLKLKAELDDSVILVSAPLIVKPLVNQKMLRRECSFVNTDESHGTKKNFKVFKKVLPSFVAKLTAAAGRGQKIQENPDASFVIEEIRAATKAIKLVPYKYWPGSDGVYVETKPPVVASRRDDPIDVPVFDVLEEFDVIPQQRSPTKRTTRRQEAGSSSVQETAQRRSSPRKKVSPPVRMAPPPPKINLAPVEIQEDDDDMWSFNQ